MKTTIESEWEALLTRCEKRTSTVCQGLDRARSRTRNESLRGSFDVSVKACEQLCVCSGIISDAGNLDRH